MTIPEQDDDFDDLDEWQPDDFGPIDTPNSAIQRAYKIIISFAMILLVLTSIGVGYWLFPILEGQVESDAIGADRIINVNDEVKVVLAPTVYEKLLKLYYEQPEHEFKACLIGRKQGTTYVASELHIPKTYQQSFAHVIAEQCPPETIISLHTHPYKHCIFSEIDIQSYETFRAINPEGIIGLMCEPERFTFYGGAIIH